MTVPARKSANDLRGAAASRRRHWSLLICLLAPTPSALAWPVAADAPERRISLSEYSTGGGLYWTEGQSSQFDAAPRLNLSATADVERAVDFNWTPLRSGEGALSLFAKFGHVSPPDLRSIDDLLWGPDETRRNATVSTGYSASLLGQRATVAGAVSWSSDAVAEPDIMRLPLPFAPVEDRVRTGVANWQKIDLTAIDEPGMRWTVSAETSQAERGFVANSLGRPRGAAITAGTRRRLDTRLVADDAVVRASFDDQSNDQGTRSRSLVSMAYSGLEVGIRSWTSAASLIQRRADGLSLEISTHDLPFDVGDTIGDASFLVPDLVSINVERGTAAYSGQIGCETKTSGFEALASWETPVGAFGLLLAHEEEVPATAEVGSELSSETGLLDVSYQWRSGDWTATAGVFLMRLGSGAALSESEETVAGRLSLGYEPENGVKLSANIGPSLDRYDWSDADFVGSGRALELSLSADLTALAKEWTDRPDASLKIEYRGMIYDDAVPNRERQDRHAFLASLNVTY